MDDYGNDDGTRREYTCRVCDGPVEPVEIVCDECSRREADFQLWDYIPESWGNEAQAQEERHAHRDGPAPKLSLATAGKQNKDMRREYEV